MANFWVYKDRTGIYISDWKPEYDGIYEKRFNHYGVFLRIPRTSVKIKIGECRRVTSLKIESVKVRRFE